MELLDLNIEEEIEEKNESYYEIVDSQQTKITLEKKNYRNWTKSRRRKTRKKRRTYKWK